MFVNGDGDLQIATEDHGGEGPPMLLTHGAGTNRRSLDALVPLLTPRFRVITFELRNHGESGRGPWAWPAVVGDVDAVRAAYDLDKVVVAGHSLGGMVAAVYATEQAQCVTHAINIDGHGQGRASQYDGMTPEEVEAAWARLEDAQKKLMPTSPEDLAAFEEMFGVLKQLDMFDLWTNTPTPLLIFNATGDDPMAQLPDMEWMGDVMAAYRRGLTRDLAALATSKPSIEIAPIDASHWLIVTHQQEVADRMIAFAAQ